MEHNQTDYFVAPKDIQLSAYQVESARAVFDLFDVNNTQDISKDEMQLAFEQFGKVLTTEELNSFFDQFDTDKSNTIDFEEYLQVVKYQFARISNDLSKNKTFKGKFSPDELKVILEFIDIKSYSKGEEIQKVGEPSRAACVILHGDIRMTCDPYNENDIAQNNHIFGMSAFSENGSQANCVTAESEVVLAIFDVENLEMLLLRDAQLYRKLKSAFKMEEDTQEVKEKYVALIAHNNVKKTMVAFIEKHISFFSKVPIVGTLSTGSILFEKLGVSLAKKVASGPLGGDQAIGALIEPGMLSAVFFFRDPLTSHPHQSDIDALCRLCDVYQIPFATNPNSAEGLVMYLEKHGLNGAEDKAEGLVKEYFSNQSSALRKI